MFYFGKIFTDPDRSIKEGYLEMFSEYLVEFEVDHNLVTVTFPYYGPYYGIYQVHG